MDTKMPQLADSYLVYDEGTLTPQGKRYCVSLRDGGALLGWVERHYGMWRAFDESRQAAYHAPTRWEAATGLWPAMER